MPPRIISPLYRRYLSVFIFFLFFPHTKTVEDNFKNGAAGKRDDGILSTLVKYFLLYMLIAFLGWLWEVLYVRFVYGEFTDRGFISMPFCPIYGTAVFSAYFLLGTPQKGRGILKNVKSALAINLLYLLFALLIPTLTELIIGIFFDKVLGVTLWDYSYMPLNFGGYICLPVSLVWTAAVYAFMRFAFLPLKNAVFRIPNVIALILAVALFIAASADAVINFLML